MQRHAPSTNAHPGATRGRYRSAALMAYEPAILDLISDDLAGSGRFEMYQDDLVSLVQKHNTSAKTPVRINTVQFGGSDPLTRSGLTGTMQRLAQETGGNDKFIGARDLN